MCWTRLPTQGGLHHGAGTGQELQSRLKGTPTNRLFCASIFREIKIFTVSTSRNIACYNCIGKTNERAKILILQTHFYLQ